MAACDVDDDSLYTEQQQCCIRGTRTSSRNILDKGVCTVHYAGGDAMRFVANKTIVCCPTNATMKIFFVPRSASQTNTVIILITNMFVIIMKRSERMNAGCQLIKRTV